MYDEAIHVPLIIKQEGNAGAGRRIADLVQHIDLVPTILDLVKAPVPGNLRGRSLKPLLEGTGQLPAGDGLLRGAVRALPLRLERADRAHRRALPLHQGAARGALRPRSAIRTSGPISPSERPQPRQALRGALDRVAAGATIQAPSDVSAEARERLQALGYVGAQTDVSTAPGDDAARSEGQAARSSSATARRSTSPASGSGAQAIALLQQILRDDPEMADVWSQLAVVRDARSIASTSPSTPTSTTSR